VLSRHSLIGARRKSDPYLSFSPPESFAVKILPAHSLERLGGTFVVQDLKPARKPYSAPTFEVLDLSSAQAKLAIVETSNDGNAREMLAVIKKQLEKQKSVEPSPAISFSSQ
jgi:hypothetical protein